MGFPVSSITYDKIRGLYLGRHMDHLADNIAKLSQGRENWYIGREGIPVDDSSAYIVTKKNPLGIKIEILESQHFPQHYGMQSKSNDHCNLSPPMPQVPYTLSEGAVVTNDWCLRVYSQVR